jgi:hypothetical protein
LTALAAAGTGSNIVAPSAAPAARVVLRKFLLEIAMVSVF